MECRIEGSSSYINFDAVAQDYDESRFLPPEVQAQAAGLLREVMALTPGQAVLDAGVGTGRFALPLAQLGIPVIGVDISLQMMARLQHKREVLEKAGLSIPLRLARGDLRRLPIASDSVGAALLVHILHLIVEWQTVLLEVRRVLAPGGAVILMGEESGRLGLPTRDHYLERARQRGVLRRRVGANGEEVRAYLTATGAQVQRVDDEQVRWTASERVADTLDRLRRRTWSSLWTVPDSDHAELLAETEAWARQTYGSLDTIEEQEAVIQVWAARWT